MALIPCPECHKKISNLAVACPNCGIPIACPECGHVHPPVASLALESPSSEYRTGFIVMTILSVFLLLGLIWFGFDDTTQVSEVAANGPTVAVFKGPRENKVGPMTSEVLARSMDSQEIRPDAKGQAVAEEAMHSTIDTVLDIASSSDAGSILMPALANAYLRHTGAREVDTEIEQGSDTIAVLGYFDDDLVQSIKIRKLPLDKVAANVVNELADFGLISSDLVSAQSRIEPFGIDAVTKLNEHVLAIDSVVIIIHPDNPILTLSKDQIAAIFNGMITDWRRVRGKPGPINVYSVDNDSGANGIFKSQILGNLKLVSNAHKKPSDLDVEQAILVDIDGIGFVRQRNVGKAKVVAISDAGKAPAIPNRYTVSTESYPLTERIYLYSRATQESPDINKFIAFALSDSTEQIIQSAGFVNTNRNSEAGPQAFSPIRKEYDELTADAMRLSHRIHFPSGTVELNWARKNTVNKMAEFVKELAPDQSIVMVFGFSDSIGAANTNLILSEYRAETVAEQLKQHGIDPLIVLGLGASNPIETNTTPEGRSSNRRVEVWVKRIE